MSWVFCATVRLHWLFSILATSCSSMPVLTWTRFFWNTQNIMNHMRAGPTQTLWRYASINQLAIKFSHGWSGLSLRGRGRGGGGRDLPQLLSAWPLATFIQCRKIEEKYKQEKPLAVWFPAFLLYISSNLKSWWQPCLALLCTWQSGGRI